jgi:hypothetical protein
MLREVTRRVAVAIALMSVLLLSSGACLLPAQQATHSCCMHMSMPCESKASCCVVTPPAPQAMVTASFHGLAVVRVEQALMVPGDDLRSRGAPTAAVLPPQSPPPGNFNLRI